MGGKCRTCGSYAINQHLHGREKGVDLDLCDVCHWRFRAEGRNKMLLENGFDEQTKEQRKAQLALNVALLDWPQ